MTGGFNPRFASQNRPQPVEKLLVELDKNREGEVQGRRKGSKEMIGFKGRTFAPVVAVSLEDLVSQDHFYRHLQQALDLSFVYDLSTLTQLLRDKVDC